MIYSWGDSIITNFYACNNRFTVSATECAAPLWSSANGLLRSRRRWCIAWSKSGDSRYSAATAATSTGSISPISSGTILSPAHLKHSPKMAANQMRPKGSMPMRYPHVSNFIEMATRMLLAITKLHIHNWSLCTSSHPFYWEWWKEGTTTFQWNPLKARLLDKINFRTLAFTAGLGE